jgi:hypothetical protein
MADCNKEFSQFLEKIQLGKSKIEHLRTSRDAMRERIKTYYKEKRENMPDFPGQGSGCLHLLSEKDSKHIIWIHGGGKTFFWTAHFFLARFPRISGCP